MQGKRIGKWHFSTSAALMLATLLLASGCSSNSKYYSLAGTATESQSKKPHLSLAIGPISMPRMLKRPQIVSRVNRSQVVIAEQEQWGGILKEEINQALIDNFATLLGTDKVEAYPVKPGVRPSYQVRIEIQKFDGELGKDVQLQSHWTLYKGTRIVAEQRSLITQPIKGSGYESYVRAMDAALLNLSKKIAAKIR